jgi:hypothetical protein
MISSYFIENSIEWLFHVSDLTFERGQKGSKKASRYIDFETYSKMV